MKKTAKMTLARIMIRKHTICSDWFYWATVRPYHSTVDYFCYDTASFGHKKNALGEARSFCKWKGMRVRKIEDRTLEMEE